MGETDREQGIQQESRWSETVALRRWPLNKDLNLEAEAAQVSGNEDMEGETSRQSEQQIKGSGAGCTGGVLASTGGARAEKLGGERWGILTRRWSFPSEQ